MASRNESKNHFWDRERNEGLAVELRAETEDSGTRLVVDYLPAAGKGRWRLIAVRVREDKLRMPTRSSSGWNPPDHTSRGLKRSQQRGKADGGTKTPRFNRGVGFGAEFGALV
jgi:hypothetical protein